jgi:uroporphyrinogen decarboxylase
LLKQTAAGGYALGTGNSIPEFIPDENYFAMLKASWSDGL